MYQSLMILQSIFTIGLSCTWWGSRPEVEDEPVQGGQQGRLLLTLGWTCLPLSELWWHLHGRLVLLDGSTKELLLLGGHLLHQEVLDIAHHRVGGARRPEASPGVQAPHKPGQGRGGALAGFLKANTLA